MSSLGLHFSPTGSPTLEDASPKAMLFDDLINNDQCASPTDTSGLDSAFASQSISGYYAPKAFYQPSASLYAPAGFQPSAFQARGSQSSQSPSEDSSDQPREYRSASSESSTAPPLIQNKELPNELLILGIPDEGTRTRVETQIRVTMMLVRRTTHQAVRLTTPSGQLSPLIKDHAVKLANWKYLKLPAYTAIKRKHKKHLKADTTPEDTLYLECQVLRSQEPREVFICANCNERERKRTQRKKDARIKPPEEIETDGSNTTAAGNGDYDRRKIILFNCGEFLEFAEGETTIPTRIACYCRHHKEKDGFILAVQLKDHNGNLIASAETPRIFTTDDHKARARPRPGYSGESSANVSRDTSYEDLASMLEQGIQTVGKHAKKPSFGSIRSRSTGSVHDDFMDAMGKNRRADKPYEQTSRRKRSGSLSRASMFSMTPMDLSRRNSPEAPNIQLPPGTVINTMPDSLMDDSLPSAGFQDSTVQDFPYSLAPASPAYSITNALNDAFSAQHLLGASPTMDSFSSSLGLTMPPVPVKQIPEITKVIPAEGNLTGGYQITVIGSNFSPDQVCYFGNVEALSTQFHSSSTLICTVPPGLVAGRLPLTVKGNGLLQSASSLSFTYTNQTDQSVLEIALQIVGFKLTGRYDNAQSIAQQIIAQNAFEGTADPSNATNPQTVSPGTTLNGLK